MVGFCFMYSRKKEAVGVAYAESPTEYISVHVPLSFFPLRRQKTLDFSCNKRNNPETQTETKKKLRLEISLQRRDERN
jgi:hypothetical protein